MNDVLNEQYYINKLSLFLQQDDALVARFKDVFSFYKNYNDTIALMNFALSTILTGIFDSSETIDEYAYSDLLNKIAACFNLSRNFELTFNDVDKATYTAFWHQYIDQSTNPITQVDLNNEQLRFLIASKIATNSYDGSAKTAIDLYNILTSKFINTGDKNWKIYAVTSALFPGVCIITLDIYPIEDVEFSDDDKEYIAMFFAGLMTLKSVGINYILRTTSIRNSLIWSSSPEDEDATTWDDYFWL